MNQLNRIFCYLSVTILILFQSNLLSQTVLDSIVVTGKKYKSFEEQIREEARNDIANGKVILFSYGWPSGKINEDELEKLTYKYGFRYERRGDVVSSIDVIYKNEVMQYLNKRNGDGWWDIFQEEEAKLITPLSLPK
jgi:hypothetical protein